MCGGRGKRLGELTEKVPKPLAKINNRSILEWKIDQYLLQGYNDYIFCVGYQGELIEEVVKEKYPGINAVFSNAGEEAGILGRIHRAKGFFDEYVIMTYGDTFTDIKLSHIVDAHQNSDNEATIIVAPIQNPFGIVEFDHNNKVTLFKEKPTLNYYIGYAVINKSALDLVSDKIIHMTNGKGLVMFYKILSAMQKLGAYYHSGVQITFNTPEELEMAEKQFARFYTLSEGGNQNE